MGGKLDALSADEGGGGVRWHEEQLVLRRVFAACRDMLRGQLKDQIERARLSTLSSRCRNRMGATLVVADVGHSHRGSWSAWCTLLRKA